MKWLEDFDSHIFFQKMASLTHSLVRSLAHSPPAKRWTWFNFASLVGPRRFWRCRATFVLSSSDHVCVVVGPRLCCRCRTTFVLSLSGHVCVVVVGPRLSCRCRATFVLSLSGHVCLVVVGPRLSCRCRATFVLSLSGHVCLVVASLMWKVYIGLIYKNELIQYLLSSQSSSFSGEEVDLLIIGLYVYYEVYRHL